MNIYYLYLKTHKKTGYKYLGYTKKNPHNYLGSGYSWLPHLKEHGNDIITYVLQSGTRDSVTSAGRYYSKIWNIVESDDYANRIPETGGGIGTPHKNRGENNPMYGRTREDLAPINQSSKRRNEVSNQMKKQWEDPEYRKKMSEARKKEWEDPEYRKKMRNRRHKETKPCLAKGMKFSNQYEAADALGIHQSTVSRRVRSKDWPDYQSL